MPTIGPGPGLAFSPWRPDGMLFPRDAHSALQNDAHKGWNWCMDRKDCRWPVIIVIIIIVLFLLSIVICIVRCCCCGVECARAFCCCCCRCCCCPRRPVKKTQVIDNTYPTGAGYGPPPMPPTYAPPQTAKYAQFDTPTRGAVRPHSDALMPMPRWEDAMTRRIEDDSPDVEMNHLDPASGQSIGRSGYAAVAPASPSSPTGGLAGYRGTETTSPYARTTSPLYNAPSPVAAAAPLLRTPSPARSPRPPSATNFSRPGGGGYDFAPGFRGSADFYPPPSAQVRPPSVLNPRASMGMGSVGMSPYAAGAQHSYGYEEDPHDYDYGYGYATASSPPPLMEEEEHAHGTPTMSGTGTPSILQVGPRGPPQGQHYGGHY